MSPIHLLPHPHQPVEPGHARIDGLAAALTRSLLACTALLVGACGGGGNATADSCGAIGVCTLPATISDPAGSDPTAQPPTTGPAETGDPDDTGTAGTAGATDRKSVV